MSSTLKIEPANRERKSLSSDLKFVLRKMNRDKVVSNFLVTENDISYFKGLRDAGIEDAEIVISFIDKYGDCIIDEQF